MAVDLSEYEVGGTVDVELENGVKVFGGTVRVWINGGNRVKVLENHLIAGEQIKQVLSYEPPEADWTDVVLLMSVRDPAVKAFRSTYGGALLPDSWVVVNASKGKYPEYISTDGLRRSEYAPFTVLGVSPSE